MSARGGLRRPPAYLRYATDSQVGPQYRMPLAAHGLLALIQDVLWLADDDCVPSDPAELALLIRRPVEEVVQALPIVLRLNDILDTTVPGVLSDPRLTAYKSKVKELSHTRSKIAADAAAARQAAEAKVGARAVAKAVAKAGAIAGTSDGAHLTPNSTPTSPQSLGSSAISTVKDIDDPWVEDLKDHHDSFPGSNPSTLSGVPAKAKPKTTIAKPKTMTAPSTST